MSGGNGLFGAFLGTTCHFSPWSARMPPPCATSRPHRVGCDRCALRAGRPGDAQKRLFVPASTVAVQLELGWDIGE